MQKKIITDHQLYSLIANGAFGGSVMVIASVLAAIAKQDAWISALLAPVLGIPVIWIYWFLGNQYPGLTFVDIIKRILGKWLVTIAALSYIFL